ncbi:MAG: RecQ family ATP-dependent DNA helicase [Cyanobacteria bacterium J06634_6]
MIATGAAGNTTAELAALRKTFQKIWGYDDFRSPQGEIAQAILNGQDTLTIMPTGGGKSICFQLPALMNTGLTLIVSPLVALMENQVQELREKNLPAATLHSELKGQQRWRTLRAIENNRLRLLYLSPETLLSKAVWEILCRPDIQINALVLDEAHCLTQWGDSFRPTYRRLGAVRPALLECKPEGTKIAIAAFTATADSLTQKTLRSVLRLRSPQVIRLNPYRSNLQLSVQAVWSPRGRQNALAKFVRSQGKQGGLIYARTRRGTEALAQWFAAKGYSVKAYHGGLGAPIRRRIEAEWISGRCQFVVCTSAFGMGINKPDCRFIAHYEVPSLISEYVQEVGRGGRDGKPATALALVSEPTGFFSPEDKQRWKFFEQKAQLMERTAIQLIRKIPERGSIDDVTAQFKEGAQALALLHRNGQLFWEDPFTYRLHKNRKIRQDNHPSASAIMKQYLFTKKCRWQVLLQAFGFKQEAKGMRCGTCDRCCRK